MQELEKVRQYQSLVKRKQFDPDGYNKTKTKKKAKKNIPSGIAHINSTFNNTIVTITDTSGNTISWSSSGNKGFKGSRKSHLLRHN